MNIFDFVTQDELDELPEDSNLAFSNFVRLAQRRLAERTVQLEHEENWYTLEEARHGFMNVVIAAAKRYEIEPFSSLEVPRIDSFNSDIHRQFRADLDHYLTQLLLDNTIRGRRDSVLMPENAKDRIRGHIHGLKTCIDNGDFTDAKKSALLNKLDGFESELDKRRLSLLAVTRVTLEFLALPGAVWASTELTTKLITNVLQEVGEAKAAEDESRQVPPIEVPAILSPPRREKPEMPRKSDVDDEIPF